MSLDQIRSVVKSKCGAEIKELYEFEIISVVVNHFNKEFPPAGGACDAVVGLVNALLDALFMRIYF